MADSGWGPSLAAQHQGKTLPLPTSQMFNIFNKFNKFNKFNNFTTFARCAKCAKCAKFTTRSAPV